MLRHAQLFYCEFKNKVYLPTSAWFGFWEELIFKVTVDFADDVASLTEPLETLLVALETRPRPRTYGVC